MKKNTSNKVDHLLKHVVAAVKKAENKEERSLIYLER